MKAELNAIRSEIDKWQNKKSYHLKEARRHNDELRKAVGQLDLLQMKKLKFEEKERKAKEFVWAEIKD